MQIILIVILIICSAYFSATETALSSANKIRLKHMADTGNRAAGDYPLFSVDGDCRS